MVAITLQTPPWLNKTDFDFFSASLYATITLRNQLRYGVLFGVLVYAGTFCLFIRIARECPIFNRFVPFHS